MSTQLGKNFIVTLMAVVLALGGLTWLSERGQSKDAPPVVAMTETAQPTTAAIVPASQRRQEDAAIAVPDSAQASRDAAQSDIPNSAKPAYDDGYRTGYQDGQRDCQQTHAAVAAPARPATRYYATRSTRHYYASRSYARSGVAGVAYVAPKKRDHSTRNMILTVAAPAALAAGIGGIAGGGKGAGIGALIGGGGGALYYLLKHK
jgi:hypothetical protein